MRTNFSKTLCAVAFAAMTFSFVSCKDDTVVEEFGDEQAAAVASQFVDHTVAPTYTNLAAKAELLVEQLKAAKANPTDAAVETAANTFLEAREEWEKSEAFLFGAAGDFGIDPHIDSWPLDLDALNNLLNSPLMLAALDADDGDVVAGDTLGNANLGFHGIEYILFSEGNPKAASAITDDEWIYAIAVAGDLRNRCFQLEVSWVGDDAPASHVQKLEDLELPFTVASGDYSYGENIKRAGNAGSTYASRKAALMAIVSGCIDIADEVGSSKINSAYDAEDTTYIESPYSRRSIIDFYNNIISIQNVYMGGVSGQRDESKSLHKYLAAIDENLDAKVISAINNALDKINDMPAPFVLNYSDARNGEAVEACASLSETLDEALEALKNS